MNGVVIFKGLSSAGVIQNVTNLSAGTRLTTILNLTDGTMEGIGASSFSPVAPDEGAIVQETSTDLSAKTFLAFF